MTTQLTAIKLRLPAGILPPELSLSEVDSNLLYQALGIWKFGAYLSERALALNRHKFLSLLEEMQLPLPVATEAIYTHCLECAFSQELRTHKNHKTNSKTLQPQESTAYRISARYCRYAELLDGAKHLQGHALYVYVCNWNLDNPDTPTTYEQILTLRSRHALHPLQVPIITEPITINQESNQLYTPTCQHGAVIY